MIGMPRITLIRPALKPTSTPMPDTRISAQNSPSTVDNASEPMVTTIVSQTPCSRIGKNSTASLRNFCIGSDQRVVRCYSECTAPDSSGGVGLLPPFLENLGNGAACLQLGERGVDLRQQFSIALAHADRDGANGDGLVGIDQAHLGEITLLQIVGEDRIVGET